jgi:hypothetical protein
MRRKTLAGILTGAFALAAVAPAYASPSPPTNGGNGAGK